ncbi:MAG: GGDEF domain-containing protein [Lachnospiraceae bacterium]|nr:GGDEF domain-containing protein [Lachnospiraceae bacterium]
MGYAFEDESVRELTEEMQRLLPLSGKKVFGPLKKLKEKSAAIGDDGLTGFVFFYYALAYYMKNDRERLHQSLRDCIRHLLKADDGELLARAFNLFALEAQHSGCYDIAHNYFHMAYSLVEDEPHSLVRAILDSNISNLLAETGEYAAACRRVRRTLPVIRHYSDDVMYEQNLAVAYVNISINALYAGRYKEAEKTIPSLNCLVSGHDIEESVRLSYYVLQALYAALLGAEEEMSRAAKALAEQLRDIPLYNESIYDIYNYCRLLIQKGALRSAASVIPVLESKETADISTHRCMLLTELMSAYYGKTGNRRHLNRALERQHLLARQLQENQKTMYLRSVSLMQMISDFREEQAAFRRENEALRQTAETDALTGLPNRYRLNRELEQSLDRMRKSGKRLGIGIIDIDAFKQYNDIYGHAQGDRCLRMTADALRRMAGEQGVFAARYGGDEFVLIYRDKTDKEIERFVEELRLQMPIRISHGFCNAVPDETSQPFALLAKADAEMYRQKRGNR